MPPKTWMLAAVRRDLADELAERERDDRDVVAPQAQRRYADQGAGQCRGRDGEHEDQQEVDVDAGRGRDRAAEDVHARACQNPDPKYAAV